MKNEEYAPTVNLIRHDNYIVNMQKVQLDVIWFLSVRKL